MNLQTATESLESGVYAAALTPLYEDLKCNCRALASHSNDLIRAGCKGVVLFGTTGEGTSFSVAEKKQVIVEVIRLGVDPKKMIVGICCSAISDAVELASFAVDHECAAVLIAPPFFYKNVQEEGTIDFYKKIIQSVHQPKLRVLLYHIPQFSGVPITINVIKALKEAFPETIIGIKESEGNADLTKEILSTFDDFKVFVGHEVRLSEAVQLGVAGGISGVANAYPELICSLYEYGKDQKVPNHNQVVKDLLQALKHFPLFPAIKATVEAQKGADWRAMRPPLVSLNQEQKKAPIESLKFLA